MLPTNTTGRSRKAIFKVQPTIPVTAEQITEQHLPRKVNLSLEIPMLYTKKHAEQITEQTTPEIVYKRRK